MLDDARGYLILHPDTLISGTVVSDSVACLRRSVLSTRIKSIGDRNTSLLYGNMLHQLFQSALLNEQTLEDLIKAVVKDHVEDLWCLGETEAVAVAHLRETVPKFIEWMDRFLGSQPRVGLFMLKILNFL